MEDKHNFGVEIEFNNNINNLNIIYENISKLNIPVCLCMNHKYYLNNYDKWIIDEDYSITRYKNYDYYGGEISSKILNDNKNDWQELQTICNSLIKLKSYIGPSCSSHITVDISKYINNKFFETLYKLLIIFEEEIETFYMGDSYYIRQTKSYAKSMRKRLIKNISNINFNSKDFINNIIDSSYSFEIDDGISLDKIDKGLIEIRYPNGTLNYNTIKNNINFTLDLLDSIGNNKIDTDYINYIIDNLDTTDPLYNNKLNTLIKNKFTYLVNSLNTTNNKNYIKQYKKIKEGE